MNIVAFLQNPWFKPGTAQHHIEMYRDNQDFHRWVLLCCMTGQRLERAFGKLYREIHWDNTNWRPAYESKGRVDPDYEHMEYVIVNKRPQLILSFGNQARDAVRHMGGRRDLPHEYWQVPYLHCHHPNARHKFQADLDNFAMKVFHYIGEPYYCRNQSGL